MKATDDLFRLIKSMNKLEKRYFKLFVAEGEGHSNYAKLFDAINEQKVYDEKRIRGQFSGEAFLRQLHVTKNYLYNLVLKSLRDFHAGKTEAGKIRTMLDNADLLLEKKQYDQCLKIIERAKKLAKESELFTYSLEISRMEESIMRALHDVEWLRSNLAAVYANEEDVLRKFNNLGEYGRLAQEFLILSNDRGKARTKKDLAEYGKIKSSPFLQNKKMALSDKAVISYYLTSSSCYYFTDDVESCIKDLTELRKFFDEDESRKKRYFKQYIYAVSNLLVIGHKVMSFPEMLSALNVLKSIQGKGDSNIANDQLQVLYYINALSLHAQHGRFRESASFANEAEKWLQTDPQLINQNNNDITLWSRLSYFYFGIGEYRKSLLWMNKILNGKDRQIRQDTYSSFLIFNLIIHYELGNAETLPYFTRSIYRYLMKKEKLHKFESAVLKFIRRSFDFHDKKDRLKGFVQLREELKVLIKDPLESEALSYFNLMAWLDSKIENRPFPDAVKNNIIVKKSASSK